MYVEDRPTLLVVDDQPDNLALMSGLLKEQYQVKVAINGAKALSIAQSSTPPDLILLDIMMPGMDGYEVCRLLKSDSQTAHIPVIFLTAKTEVQDEQRGFELGAVDYITKPISPPIVLARVENHLALKAYSQFMRERGDYLERTVAGQRAAAENVRDSSGLILAALSDMRDVDGINHIVRIQKMAERLIDQLQDSEYSEQISSEMAKLFPDAVAFHDLGKAAVPDHILFSNDELGLDQFEIMSNHTSGGAESIKRAEQRLGQGGPLIQLAKTIMTGHHERWDGSGYPDGIGGSEIPLAARAFAVIDVYDGMTSGLSTSPVTHQEAIDKLVDQRGEKFDPVVVDAFAAIAGDVQTIAGSFADSDEDIERKSLRLC